MLTRRWRALPGLCISCAALAGLLALALSLRDSDRVMPPGVSFSRPSGFYEDAFYLELEGNGNAIYYTLDSSDPDANATLYTGPILIQDASPNENVYSMNTDISAYYDADLIKQNGRSMSHSYRVPEKPVDKATVVRAISVDSSGNCSAATEAVYFVGFGEKTGYDGICVMSITTDPANLFDPETGIYVLGNRFHETVTDGLVEKRDSFVFTWPANYQQRGRESERRADIHCFDSRGEAVFSGQCGIRIQGRATRAHSPKNLNIYARREYGSTGFNTGALFDTAYTLNRLNLYYGSNDLMLRDYMINEMAADMNMATRQFCPCALFLDGEYWGLYWLGSRFKEDYLSQRYDVKKDNIVEIKMGKVEVGREADLALYTDMVSFIADGDMRRPETYARAQEMIDLESFIDYYALEIYIANTDWPANNYALWRSRHGDSNAFSDCRWRWMLFDVDQGMRLEKAELDSLKEALNQDAMFASLMRNPDFEAAFTARLVALATDTFAPERIDAFIDAYEADMVSAMEKKYQRFYGKKRTTKVFYNGCESIRQFFHERPAYILKAYGGQSTDEK